MKTELLLAIADIHNSWAMAAESDYKGSLRAIDKARDSLTQYQDWLEWRAKQTPMGSGKSKQGKGP